MAQFLTVSTAATPGQRVIATPAILRSQIPLLRTTNDADLTVMIEAASAVIEAKCGRVLARETLTETFDNDCFSSVLHLTRTPVVSVTSVEVDGTALASTDYRVKHQNGQLFALASGRVVPWLSGVVEVVYVAGFQPYPADLQRACAEIVSAMMSGGSRDQALKVEDIPGVGRYEYWVGAIGTSGIPTTALDLLRPYMRRHA